MYLLISVNLENTDVMRLLLTILLVSHKMNSAYVEEYNRATYCEQTSMFGY